MGGSFNPPESRPLLESGMDHRSDEERIDLSTHSKTISELNASYTLICYTYLHYIIRLNADMIGTEPANQRKLVTVSG